MLERHLATVPAGFCSRQSPAQPWSTEMHPWQRGRVPQGVRVVSDLSSRSQSLLRMRSWGPCVGRNSTKVTPQAGSRAGWASTRPPLVSFSTHSPPRGPQAPFCPEGVAVMLTPALPESSCRAVQDSNLGLLLFTALSLPLTALHPALASL